MRELADRLTDVPRGGGRGARRLARGRSIHPDSDWDFGLYYRAAISAEHGRALGFDGTVVEPGEWGRLANGAAC